MNVPPTCSVWGTAGSTEGNRADGRSARRQAADVLRQDGAVDGADLGGCQHHIVGSGRATVATVMVATVLPPSHDSVAESADAGCAGAGRVAAKSEAVARRTKVARPSCNESVSVITSPQLPAA